MAEYAELDAGLIEADGYQARSDLGDLQALEDSVKAIGFIVPIIVTLGNKQPYRLVAGRRRLEVARRLKMLVPAVVTESWGGSAAAEVAVHVAENSAREQLHWTDLADACAHVVHAGCSTEQARQAIGISKAYFFELRRLRRLACSELWSRMRRYQTSLLHAAELVKLDPRQQVKAWSQLQAGTAPAAVSTPRKQVRRATVRSLRKRVEHMDADRRFKAGANWVLDELMGKGASGEDSDSVDA